MHVVTARLAGIAGVVGVLVVVLSSGLLSADVEVIVDDAAQLVAGTAAALACWLTARRVSKPERQWRELMAFGMAGWTIGMGIWAWYRTFADEPLPSPSLADAGFFMLPVFALPALITFARAGTSQRTRSDRRRYATIMLILDSLLVVGSLFVIVWTSTLAAVVAAGAPSSFEFVVALGYPVTDLLLVSMIGLLIVARRVPRPLLPQLTLLGAGLVLISVSDVIFTYLVSTGAEHMPPVADTGFIAGPAMIALAATVRAKDLPALVLEHAPVRLRRAQLLLPYLLVAATIAVLTVRLAADRGLDAVELSCGSALVFLLITRQVVTIVDNSALLDEVLAAHEELSYRAHHDPLTGLANRALFYDRLTAALYHHAGEPFVLLVIDLDDFKQVNDVYGHVVGDNVLCLVGARLRTCVREADTVARLGGDEFAVVLHAEPEPASEIGHRILDLLHRPYDVDGETVRVRATIGLVAAEHRHDTTPIDILRRADNAMYRGKRTGKAALVTAPYPTP